MIIEIEGIDGVGKTTQCQLLKDWIESRGQKAIVVKDLESTRLGQSIRGVLVEKTERPPIVELFSFLACKGQLFFEVVIPSLQDNKVVLCDRGISSFISYFSVLGFSEDFLLNSVEMTLNGYRPDLTILLDIPVKDAMKRKSAKTDSSKFDQMGEKFFEEQRKFFHSMLDKNSWAVVDGSGSTLEVQREIISIVSKHRS